jgi:integrase
MKRGFFMVFANLPQVIIDWEVGKVARKRMQRGYLELIKNKKLPDSWKLTYYIYKSDGKGGLKSARTSINFGDIKKYRTEKAARIRADQILIEEGVNSGKLNVIQQTNFEDFTDSYKIDVLILKKESTQSSERSIIDKHLIPAFGKINLELITPPLVQRAVRKWSQEDNLSIKTIKNILITLQVILKIAGEWGFEINKFDTSVIRLPTREIKVKKRTFTIPQAKHIVHASPYPYNILMLTALLTGLRIGEILGLTWTNIDLEKGFIRVIQTVWQRKIQTPKSVDSERTIPIPSVLIEALRDYKSKWVSNKPELLWANEMGAPLDGDNLRHRVLRPILDDLGIDEAVGFHGFRHLAGSVLASLGVNISVIRDQFGHTDEKTTFDYYLDSIGDEHREAIEKLATALTPKITI